ncbi:hypothetical protein BJG92_02215 [Arthrobacter sp. SO5]|nr:hypothetical protein [Arthrobacter sp. SO5]
MSLGPSGRRVPCTYSFATFPPLPNTYFAAACYWVTTQPLLGILD